MMPQTSSLAISLLESLPMEAPGLSQGMCERASRSPGLQVLSPTELGALALEGMSAPAWGGLGRLPLDRGPGLGSA